VGTVSGFRNGIVAAVGAGRAGAGCGGGWQSGEVCAAGGGCRRLSWDEAAGGGRAARHGWVPARC